MKHSIFKHSIFKHFDEDDDEEDDDGDDDDDESDTNDDELDTDMIDDRDSPDEVLASISEHLIRCENLTLIDTTCVISSSNPMFDDHQYYSNK